MEKRVIAVCSVVGFLALLSAATGFAAEATRFKGEQGRVNEPSTPCHYPTGPAYGLGLTSAIALLIAEITISIASGCTCCCSKGPHRSNANWRLAVVCFNVSWFGCFLAFWMLVENAVLNLSYYDWHENVITSPGGYYVCPAANPGAFAGAATLSFVSLMLGLVYYLILSGAKKPVDSTQGGVAMAQPQFPSAANAQNPVFGQGDANVRPQSV